MACVSSILAKIHQQLYKNTTDNNKGADDADKKCKQTEHSKQFFVLCPWH